jgi:hypothetical protein
MGCNCVVRTSISYFVIRNFGDFLLLLNKE